MKIIVLVKQVPNTTTAKLDPETGNLIRQGLDSIINPDDCHALEAAVNLKDQTGGHITAISMGPPQAVDALTEALGMGADKAVLLTDPAFSGADTWATSFTLGMAVKALGPCDLIICGRQAIDGDTAQIGPQVADWLSLPQITCVSRIETVDAESLTVRKQREDGYQTVRFCLPALITVIGEINTPRPPHIGRLINACREKAPITVWNAADIGVQTRQVGIEGSLTHVVRTFAPDFRRQNKRLEGSPQEVAAQLIQLLKKSDTTIAGRLG